MPAGLRHVLRREWRRTRIRKGLRRHIIRRITTDREFLREMQDLQWECRPS